MTGTFPPEHLISVLMCKHHCSHWHSQHTVFVWERASKCAANYFTSAICWQSGWYPGSFTVN